MVVNRLGRGLIALTAATACLLVTGPSASAAPASTRTLSPSTTFYTPAPNPDAIKQLITLVLENHLHDSALVADMVATPTASWFTKGTPTQVRKAVSSVVTAAAAKKQVPVLVAYNTPFRDCSQYSSGGAKDTKAYADWISGFARGIGKQQAVVMLEPDSLGIIPFNFGIDNKPEWCQPKGADGKPAPGASPADRYAQLNAAVTRLEQLPNVSVYLDGTHANWLNVGDISQRLVKAGVQRAQGFFLNASNYVPTPQLQKYGTWISSCIAYANSTAHLGQYSNCASQYYPASPGDFSTWTKTDDWYTANIGTAVPSTHFIIDTSRNGAKPVDFSVYAKAPYNQPAAVISALGGDSWCNPPGAGLGLRPTANTGVPLLDAYVWGKVPGESDGSCDIAGGGRAWDFTVYNPWKVTKANQQHFDPLWGTVDPAAGQWFPQQALQLARKANPLH